MNSKDYYNNTLKKELIIARSLIILRTCDYDNYPSTATSLCEMQMKDLQKEWKTIGSAGNQQERLWGRFQSIQDEFWKLIKLSRKEMQLLELSDRIGSLQDDFEAAKDRRQWGRMEHLSELIDEKEDNLSYLDYEISQLKEELGIIE